MLSDGLITTKNGTMPIAEGIQEISICVHSDTPVSSFPRLFFLSFISFYTEFLYHFHSFVEN